MYASSESFLVVISHLRLISIVIRMTTSEYVCKYIITFQFSSRQLGAIFARFIMRWQRDHQMMDPWILLNFFKVTGLNSTLGLHLGTVLVSLSNVGCIAQPLVSIQGK